MDYINLDNQLKKGLDVFSKSLKSKFYSGKYNGLKAPENYSEWCTLPVLTRDEIYNHSIPKSYEMVTGPLYDNNIYRWF